MSELNQSPGGSQQLLDDMREKIQLAFKRFTSGPVLILIAVVVVVIFWTAWFTVQPEETGIVQRFGKVMRTACPGLHFKIPFGVEKVRLLPTARVLKSEAKDEIQKVLTAYETGVRLVTVELQDVTPPDSGKPAFNEVNESRQDKEQTINKAQEQANREIPRARGVATQSISEAEGYALERVNRAEGEATRFEDILNEYEKAPQVTRRRLYLEAMTGLLANMKGLYIVDQDQKAMVPWLPLESSTQPAAEGGQP